MSPYVAFCQVPNTISDTEKLFGLSTIWKEIEYNFAYFENIGSEKWDSIYKLTIPIVLETPNDYEYYRELSKFMAYLEDGHTFVGRYPNVDRYTTVYEGYWIEFERVEGKVVVSRINTSKKDSISLGSELLAINGLLTKDYLSTKVTPYISASTYKSRDRESVFFIMDGLPGMEYEIKILTPKNQIKNIHLVHGRFGEESPFNLTPPFDSKEDVQFRWLENKIAYVKLNSFGDYGVLTSFEKLLPELYKAKRLIIDIRNNTGGNSEVGFAILKYLTNDKYLYTHHSKSRKHIAHLKGNGSNISTKDTVGDLYKKEAFLNFHNKLYTVSIYEPYLNELNAKRIIIPTLVLTSNKTISAAEDFLIPIKKIEHIKTIGITTAGSTGTIYKIELPQSIGFICSLQSTYPDGSDYVGVGIEPDIVINISIKGIIEMRDEVLEEAEKYLRNK